MAGFIAHQLRDYPAAESHLRKIVSQSPDAVLPRRVLAAVFLESGQPERVFETVRPLLDANDANAHGLVGEAHLAMGDKDRALESLQRSSKLDPKSPSALYNRAVFERFYRLDRAAARQAFERFLTLGLDIDEALADRMAEDRK